MGNSSTSGEVKASETNTLDNVKEVNRHKLCMEYVFYVDPSMMDSMKEDMGRKKWVLRHETPSIEENVRRIRVSTPPSATVDSINYDLGEFMNSWLLKVYCDEARAHTAEN